MSTSYKLVCPETKEGVWIGQGNGGMKILYSGETETMEYLRRFLMETCGKELRLISEHDEEQGDYKDYKKFHCGVCQYGAKFMHFCEYTGRNLTDDEVKSDVAPGWCPLK